MKSTSHRNLLSARRQRTTGDPERRLPCHRHPCPPLRAWSSCASRPRTCCAPTAPGSPSAVARVAAHHPHPEKPLKLAGAQLVVAREHGFPSWPRLKAYVERVAAARPGPAARLPRGPRLLRGPRLRPARVGAGRHAGRRRRLRRAGTRRSTRGGRARRGRARARLRELGGAAPPRRGPARRRASRSPAPTAPSRRTTSTACARSSTASPSSWPRVGTNGNDLLGMAGATCDERLVRVLLDARRRPRAAATPTAGRRCTRPPTPTCPLLARMLLDAGAPVDVSARGDGGTPLVVALFWGHREVAELLAEHGVHPRNLRVAAGLGRLDLIDELVAPDGRWRRRPARTAASTARTAASRPGSRRTTRRRCSTRRSPGRRAATASTSLEPLVARGARARGRRLPRHARSLWAAASGRAAAVRAARRARRRPERPLDLRRPDARRGRDRRCTSPRRAATSTPCGALLEPAPTRRARDANFDATPDGWAEYGGHPEVAAAIRDA